MRKNSRFIMRLVPIAAMALFPALSFANGFSLNIQSASGAGTAEAGRSTVVSDATVIYGNPAGLVHLKKPQITTGFGAILASVDIADSYGMTAQGTPVFGSSQGDSVPTVVVPFSFAAYPLNDRVALGIGLYAPFGLENNYEPSFIGRYHGVRSKVAVMTVQPTVSVKVTDRLSFGFGPTINRISGHLKNHINIQHMGGGDAIVDIKGTDSGAMGFNAGVMFDATPKTRLGLAYHSRVNYKLTGRTKITGMPGALAVMRFGAPAKLNITLPESVDFSVTQKLSDQWSLHAGATWTRWSQLRTLDVQNETPVAAFRNVSESFHWRNVWAYAVGASYQVTPNVVLRAGFAYDASPTSMQTRNVRIPVGDRRILGLGAGWTPAEDWTFDAAYTYISETNAHINQSARGTTVPSYHARYKNKGHGFAVQVTKRF